MYPKLCYVCGVFFNKMDIFELNIATTNSVLQCGCLSMNFQMYPRVYRIYCEMNFSPYEYSHYRMKWNRISGAGFEDMFHMYNNATKAMFSHIQ